MRTRPNEQIRDDGEGCDDRRGIVTGVVLAAGLGRRMGIPKALLQLGKEALIVHHVRAYRNLGLPVVVVGADWSTGRLPHLGEGVEVRPNPDPGASDMAMSLEIGLAGVGIALVSPVDVPPPRPETLRVLLATTGDAVPTFDGRDGHPVRVEPPHPPGRLDLRLAGARRVAVADPDCVLDFDTPEAWSAWLGRRPER